MKLKTFLKKINLRTSIIDFTIFDDKSSFPIILNSNKDDILKEKQNFKILEKKVESFTIKISPEKFNIIDIIIFLK